MKTRYFTTGMSLAFAAALSLGAPVARADEASDVDIGGIRNELSKAKFSADEADAAAGAKNGAPASDGFSMKDDADLERTRTLLLEKESQLLNTLKQDEPAAETALSNEPPAVGAPEPVKAEVKDDPTAKQLQTKVSNQTAEISTLKRSNSSLEGQLSKLKARNAELLAELESVRNKLFIAESEVERLSSTLEARNASTLHRLAPGALTPARATTTLRMAAPVRPAPIAPIATAPASAKARLAEPPRAASVQPAGDMPTALVTADKANLRTAPSKDSAPFMTVSKGTRLVVESQRDGWYSVYAPNGSRAWVSGEVLQFGTGDLASGRTTIRPKAYDPSL